MVLCAVNGVILADVNIVCIFTDRQVGAIRDVGESLIGRRCNSICLALKNGTAEKLPVKTPKKSRRIEEKTVFILSCDGYYALQKRPSKGLLAGLWQFPNVESRFDLAQSLTWVEQNDLKPKEILRTVERKHIFTHIEWHMRGFYMEVSGTNNEYSRLDVEQIRNEAALPTAFPGKNTEIWGPFWGRPSAGGGCAKMPICWAPRLSGQRSSAQGATVPSCREARCFIRMWTSP